jgi:hypothetical protein
MLFLERLTGNFLQRKNSLLHGFLKLKVLIILEILMSLSFLKPPLSTMKVKVQEMLRKRMMVNLKGSHIKEPENNMNYS